MDTKAFLIIGLSLVLVSCAKENNIPNDNETLSKVYIYDPSTQNSSTSEYKYDGVGNLIEINSVNGNASTAKETLLYDTLGNILSYTLWGSDSGNIYKYDFQVGLKGRIIKATATAFLANWYIDNHTYTYDTQGRLIIDSAFWKSGTLDSYINFNYDDNNNIIAYQQYFNISNSIENVNNMTIQYDTKRSPYFKVGQLLYTSMGGGTTSFFYLSKNNPTSETLNNTVITPGGKFIYQYYANSLLKTRTVNEPNSTMITFYYTR